MDFVELFCKTHYSFLSGASRPHEIVERAIKLQYSAIGICDNYGVYGFPKAYHSVKTNGFPIKLIIGATIEISGKNPISLIATSRRSYGLLCRIITEAHKNEVKGYAELSLSQFFHLIETYPGRDELILALQGRGKEPYSEYVDFFGNRVFYKLSRNFDGQERIQFSYAKKLLLSYGIRPLATNMVYFHDKDKKKLHDVLTSIRLQKTLPEIGYQRTQNSEHYLKSPHQMIKLFSDWTECLDHTMEIAERSSFCGSELRYYYPSEWIPQGETAESFLKNIIYEGAKKRYPHGLPEAVLKQIEHELKLVRRLKFADYFLTIWDIVKFAKENQILCQGRGSAANSIICYCLGITAIDPVRMDLLFERFISEERGEPPDIDVDFEHERREEVIQYVYRKYGRDRAAMVSAIVTYKSRSALRDVAKSIGVPCDQKLKRALTQKEQALIEPLVEEIKGFPRHLSIHSGGFTLSSEPIIETVPVEPARMQGRTIVQWDKEDLEIMGLLKVDLLSLGMLTAIRKTLDNISSLSFDQIPADDFKTYQMIQKADTVGTFQIESRAQMSMLGRLQPKNFYDLVVEVAIVRPGPIVGKMVHPYLKRRRGIEKVTYEHPQLKKILDKTLGVPLFQEQVMKMAIDLAGFTPGEADELRRAIGAWRSVGSVEKIGRRLKVGLLKKGLSQEFVQRIFNQIKGFSEYGFPESHAASFALIAYISCYLKCHYPAQFTLGLINSQPMGFYSVHSLIDDAKRHGVRVLKVNPHFSEWDSVLTSKGEIQMGFRTVCGCHFDEISFLLKQRKIKPFKNLSDFVSRAQLRRDVLYRLAIGDVFSVFGFDQRHALWMILEYEIQLESRLDDQLNLFAGSQGSIPATPLFESMDTWERIQYDYRSYRHSVRGHPMQGLRERVKTLSQLNTLKVKKQVSGSKVRVAGLLIVRQRPPTAGGVSFATLEDEYGLLDLTLFKKTFEKYESIFLTESFLEVYGEIQKDGNSINLLVHSLKKIRFTKKTIKALSPESMTNSSFMQKRMSMRRYRKQI
ncbi:MAG: error-prone DNA polymerase [Bdellovibrionaceae bacterium]|nr:error-prone DNA polymerase [Pseudobdellovibrionaceae bacterium]|tara:strand:+ start:7357 stop:10437 length:3081 start_codon:yes stop_codon:yes gene_type:complete